MVLFGITILYIVLMVATYILYYKEPVIVCAENMLLAQSLAFVFQIFLTYVGHRSNNKILILAVLFSSAMLFLGALSAFFNLGLMCDFYGF